MKNEPVTGQARELEITGINLNVNYQESLITKDGQLIMKGEVKTFTLGNNPMAIINASQEDEDKKQVIAGKIADLVAEYLQA